MNMTAEDFAIETNSYESIYETQLAELPVLYLGGYHRELGRHLCSQPADIQCSVSV